MTEQGAGEGHRARVGCKMSRIQEIVMLVVAATVFIALPYLLLHYKPSAEQIMTEVAQQLARRDPVISSQLSEEHSIEKQPIEKDPTVGPPIGEPSVQEESGGRQANLESTLDDVLASAAMADKTVIITTLNQAWAANNTMIDLFLESFHRGEDTAKLLNHLVIVALDQKSYDRCQQLHSHCLMLKTEGVDFAGFKPYMSTDFLKMMWRRMEFMKNILELGYNFVFSDADIVWFRNPFDHFAEHVDFQISSDRYRGDPESDLNRPNCGFVFTRSNNRTIAMYKRWCEGGVMHPGIDEQRQLFSLIRQKVLAKLGVKMHFLETDRFSGLCQKSEDMTKVVTMHANCCTGLNNKINDLRLSLDDWEAGKSTPPPVRPKGSTRRINLWHAPVACRKSIWPPPRGQSSQRPAANFTPPPP